jgi:hypothetical protein
MQLYTCWEYTWWEARGAVPTRCTYKHGWCLLTKRYILTEPHSNYVCVVYIYMVCIYIYIIHQFDNCICKNRRGDWEKKPQQDLLLCRYFTVNFLNLQKLKTFHCWVCLLRAIMVRFEWFWFWQDLLWTLNRAEATSIGSWVKDPQKQIEEMEIMWLNQ